MNINEAKNIFIVGIKGVGMANIALVLNQMGKQVSGSDTADEFITDGELKNNNIKVYSSFEGSDLPDGTDLLIYSGSHHGSQNPQVIEAKKKGVMVMSQAVFLGKFMKHFKTSVAVCGTHGKTTTASLLSFMLLKLAANPTYIVGTSSFNDVNGGAYGSELFFVLEADEYAVDPPTDLTPKLLHLSPTHILCTSVDFDHPDVYQDIEETKRTFLAFIKKSLIADSQKNNIFLNGDDPNIRSILKDLPTNSITTYGFSENTNVQIKNTKFKGLFTTFDLYKQDEALGSFSIKLYGEKLIADAAGVVSLLLELGFKSEDIASHISQFTGAKRRFEHIALINGVELFDDYAHHPVEIKATIEAAKIRFDGRRIIIIFQPHTFSRTEILKQEFVEALSLVDQTYIAPIFASAREDSSALSITSEDLVQIAKQKGINTIDSCKTKDELVTKLLAFVKPDDVIFTMGAGDVYKLKDDIIRSL